MSINTIANLIMALYNYNRKKSREYDKSGIASGSRPPDSINNMMEEYTGLLKEQYCGTLKRSS